MMAQELLDEYHRMDSRDRASVDELLREVGGTEALDMFRERELTGGCSRLQRRGFQLWLSV